MGPEEHSLPHGLVSPTSHLVALCGLDKSLPSLQAAPSVTEQRTRPRHAALRAPSGAVWLLSIIFPPFHLAALGLGKGIPLHGQHLQKSNRNSSNKQELHQQQVSVPDQNSTTGALKTKLLLEPQPTKVGQEVCDKPKQKNCLLKLDI